MEGFRPGLVGRARSAAGSPLIQANRAVAGALIPAAGKWASICCSFCSPCRQEGGREVREPVTRRKIMSRITTAALTALSYVAAISFAMPLAANAAPAVGGRPPAPSQPIARPPSAPSNPIAPVPAPGSNPYQPVIQNDVTGAYQFRTRILMSPPSCQDFANQADSVFVSSVLDDATKTAELKKIQAATTAAGCLAP